jgi:hypothetical protein
MGNRSCLEAEPRLKSTIVNRRPMMLRSDGEKRKGSNKSEIKHGRRVPAVLISLPWWG